MAKPNQKPKRPSWRPGDEVVLAAHKSVIPAYDGKPQIGHEDVLRVSSVTGTGSLSNPYGTVITDGRHFWHLLPDDVVPAGRPAHSAVKKSPKQLDAEIEEALKGGRKITVVVAWTEDEQKIAPNQKAWRHDLGERPKFVDVEKAHAAVWINRGTQADLAKAHAYIQKTYPATGHVFTYPVTEKDPLGRARRDILR
jgi:hypothetical protein